MTIHEYEIKFRELQTRMSAYHDIVIELNAKALAVMNELEKYKKSYCEEFNIDPRTFEDEKD